MDYYEEQVRKCDVFNMVPKNVEGEGKREGGRVFRRGGGRGIRMHTQRCNVD